MIHTARMVGYMQRLALVNVDSSGILEQLQNLYKKRTPEAIPGWSEPLNQAHIFSHSYAGGGGGSTKYRV